MALSDEWLPIDREDTPYDSPALSGKAILAIDSMDTADKPYVCYWVWYSGLAMRDGRGDWVTRDNGKESVVHPSFCKII